MATEVSQSHSTDTPTPFDFADADIILRSSDNVNYRVHKQILTLASPIFNDMLSVPQGARDSDKNGADWHDGLPLAVLPETSVVLEALLRCSYPYPYGPGTLAELDLDDVFHAFDAARKYEMIAASHAMEAQLKAWARREPMRVFAGAQGHLRWEQGVLTAARATLSMTRADLQRPLPELAQITGLALMHLFEYRTACEHAVLWLTKDISWMSFRGQYVHCTCSKGQVPTGLPTTYISHKQPCAASCPSEWWLKYLEDVGPRLASNPYTDLNDPDVLWDIAVQSARCQSCGPSSRRDIKMFNSALRKQVDTVIDEETKKLGIKLCLTGEQCGPV